MSDTPERISISPTYRQKRDDDYYLVDRGAFPGKGTEYIRADIHLAEIERLTAVNAELLEALEAILATWDGPKYDHFMGPNIDLAREAIAKAKGGDT